MNEHSVRERSAAALEKYGGTIYRICLLYMKNRDDAEDAFQDVFLRYIQADRRFENEEHEKAWLCTVAFNRCKDLLKSAAHKTVGFDDVAEPSVCDEVRDSPVLEAVMALPTKYKDVIYLHYYEDWPAAKIAKVLKCSENAVYSQLSRGRQLLKERLGDDFED